MGYQGARVELMSKMLLTPACERRARMRGETGGYGSCIGENEEQLRARSGRNGAGSQASPFSRIAVGGWNHLTTWSRNNSESIQANKLGNEVNWRRQSTAVQSGGPKEGKISHRADPNSTRMGEDGKVLLRIQQEKVHSYG